MARHIDDDNDADVDAYEGDSDDGDAHDDDDGEVRAAAANSPSRASPPALSCKRHQIAEDHHLHNDNRFNAVTYI